MGTARRRTGKEDGSRGEDFFKGRKFSVLDTLLTALGLEASRPPARYYPRSYYCHSVLSKYQGEIIKEKGELKKKLQGTDN
jgi:hypothetical protein